MQGTDHQIIEILTPHGTTSLKNAKIFGGSVSKTYDKQLKGYFYPLDSSSSSGAKIQFPKDEKAGLGLTFPFLVLQILIPSGKQFGFEVSIMVESATNSSTKVRGFFVSEHGKSRIES